VGVDQANPPCSRIGPSLRPDDPATTFVSEGSKKASPTAVAAAQGKDVVLFGATVPRLALAHGLVDEFLRSGP
jgi:dihydrofolate reductase